MIWQVKFNFSLNMKPPYSSHIASVQQPSTNNKFYNTLLQIEPVIEKGNEALVHHIIVYACWGVTDMHIRNTNKTSGVCSTAEMPEFESSCRNLFHAWAVGAGVSRYLEHKSSNLVAWSCGTFLSWLQCW